MTGQAVPQSPDPAFIRIALVLTVEGTPFEAWAFAQFLKRATWDHDRSLAVSDDEAYAMQRQGERLRRALPSRAMRPGEEDTAEGCTVSLCQKSAVLRDRQQ